MRKACSLEVAQLMIDQDRPLTVSEISCLLAMKDSTLTIDHNHTSYIVRHFAESHHCTCVISRDSYPPRYHLKSIEGYTFKIRNMKGFNPDAFPIYAKRPAVMNNRQRQREKEKRSSELLKHVFMVMGGHGRSFAATHSGTREE